MILDNYLMFDSPISPASFINTVAGTYASTNVIDWGVISGIPSSANGGGARDMGVGDDPALKLLVQVSTAFTSGGAATLTVAIQGAADAGTGVPGAYTTWWQSPAYALATIAVQGARLLDMDFPRPPAGVAVPRFVRLLYTIGAATTTAGGLISGIVLDRPDQMYQGTGNAVLGGYVPGITVAN